MHNWNTQSTLKCKIRDMIFDWRENSYFHAKFCMVRIFLLETKSQVCLSAHSCCFARHNDKINVQITLEPLQLFCIKFDWYWKIKINFKIGSLLEASYALGRTLEKGCSVVQVEEVESSLWLAPLNSPWLYMEGICHGLVDLLKNIPLGYWSELHS